MANEILGSKSYLQLITESTWGVNPDTLSGSGSGAAGTVHLPVDEYSVRFRPENRQANPFLGIYQRKHSKNFRGLLQGSLRCPLYGWNPGGTGGVSLAEWLMNWAFESHESNDLPSKSAYWIEGPDTANVEHNGLRVNQATLQGSDDSGIIEIQLDLMGKNEDTLGNSQAPPNDREKCVEFEFQDASFQLAGSAVSVKSFSLQLNRALQAHYLNSYSPTHLFPGDYAMTLQLVIVKNAATYDAIRRAETTDERTGRITLQGLHNGTLGSTYAQVQIDFDRLHTMDVDDDRARQNLNFQTLNFVVLKPDTSNNGFRTTWSVV